MTSDLSAFAARLREFIAVPNSEPGTRPPSAASLLRRTGNSELPFASLALELFALQFTRNAAYRKICEARKQTPLTVTHWSQIPTVPTAAFKELELSCLPPAERTHVFHSSGTTEQRPSRHFHNADSLAVYEASLWAWFEQNSPATVGLLSLTPPPAQAPHSSLVHMFDVVRQKLEAPESIFVGRAENDGAWTIDFNAALAACSRRREEAEPLLVLGTAFSFVHLLDHLAEKNLRLQLPAGSRVLETGGYKGRSRTMPKAELHALITQHLGVPRSHIICEYGMSELSSQAYDSAANSSRNPQPATRPFHFPPWARVQIISPETGREVADGETGLIRIFDLANVFSVMAIQTEDLSIRHGDGFDLLGRAQLSESRGCSLMTA